MNRKIYFSILIASLAGFILTSCDPITPEPPVGPDTPENPDTEVTDTLTFSCILASEKGSSITMEIDTKSSWSVLNENSDITISPTEGDTNVHTLTITAANTNEDLLEKVYRFSIIDGSEPQAHKYYVIQRGSKGIDISQKEYNIGASDIYINIPYKGAFSTENLDAQSNVSWIKFFSIDTTVSSKLLDDGLTYSNYSEGLIKFLVTEENKDSNPRNAKLNIILGEQNIEIAVTQKVLTISDPDFSREFFKTSVVHKVSGTFCTACPYMTYHLDSLNKIMPGRTIAANIHTGSSNDLDWLDGWKKLVKELWKEGYLPTGFFNNYGDVMGLSTIDLTKIFKELIYQACDLFPATTGIAGSATLSGNNLSIDVNIAAGDNATKSGYRLTVFLLEDGLYAEQAGAEYVNLENANIHDHVVRGSLSNDYNLGGEVIELSPRKVISKKFNVDMTKLPNNFSKIVDFNKVKVLVYVTYDDSYTPEKNGEGAVRAVEYNDFGFMIDNAAVFPVNGGVDYRYE